MSSLGKRLRAARERKNFSQVKVYKLTGINNKTLSRYENDGTEPDTDSLKRLADLYEVSTDWLLGQKAKKIENEYQYPPSENEYERLLRETEERYNVNLRDDPVALRLFQELLVGIAKTKLDNK